MGLAHNVASLVADAFGLVLARRGQAWRLIEPEQLRRFLQAFDVDCVFDVGANTGQYGRRLRGLGYKGLILSFEPNPEPAAEARAAAEADPLWVVEELALDSECRKAVFHVTAGSQFASLHPPTADAGQRFGKRVATVREITVQTRTLAQLYPDLKARFGFSRPFLKMDTQGHDLAVARGAEPYLGEFVGLQTELALTRLYEGSSAHTEALDFFTERGFALSALIPNNAGHFPDLLEVDGLLYNRHARGGPAQGRPH